MCIVYGGAGTASYRAAPPVPPTNEPVDENGLPMISPHNNTGEDEMPGTHDPLPNTSENREPPLPMGGVAEDDAPPLPRKEIQCEVGSQSANLNDNDDTAPALPAKHAPNKTSAAAANETYDVDDDLANAPTLPTKGAPAAETDVGTIVVNTSYDPDEDLLNAGLGGHVTDVRSASVAGHADLTLDNGSVFRVPSAEGHDSSTNNRPVSDGYLDVREPRA